MSLKWFVIHTIDFIFHSPTNEHNWSNIPKYAMTPSLDIFHSLFTIRCTIPHHVFWTNDGVNYLKTKINTNSRSKNCSRTTGLQWLLQNTRLSHGFPLLSQLTTERNRVAVIEAFPKLNLRCFEVVFRIGRLWNMSSMKTNFSHSRRFYFPPNMGEWKPKKEPGCRLRTDQSIGNLEYWKATKVITFSVADILKISQLIPQRCIVN